MMIMRFARETHDRAGARMSRLTLKAPLHIPNMCLPRPGHFAGRAVSYYKPIIKWPAARPLCILFPRLLESLQSKEQDHDDP